MWRQLAWTGVGVGAGLSGLSLLLGGGTLIAATVSTSVKTTRGASVRDVDRVDAIGPWLAGGANLALYAGVAAFVVGGPLFFLPAVDEAP